MKILKFASNIKKQHILYATTIFLTLLIGFILVSSSKADPIADDFWYFSRIRDDGTIRFLTDYYQYANGRITQHASVALLYELFGQHAVKVGPVFLLLALAGGFWLTITSIAHQIKRTNALILSLVFAGISFLVVPSIFDTAYWLTSSTVYLGSLIALLVNTGFVVGWLNNRWSVRWVYFISLVTVFFGQMFSEPVSAMTIVGLGFGLIYFAFRRQLRPSIITGGWLASAVAGFLVMYFSPGTRSRIEYHDIHLSLFELVGEFMKHWGILLSTLASWKLIVVLALTGLIICMTRLRRKSLVRTAIVGSAVAVIIPSVVIFVSVYSLGTQVPYRALTIAYLAFYLGVALVLAALVVKYRLDRNQLFFSVAFVAILASALATVIEYRTIYSAMSQRSSLSDEREGEISRQINDGERTIYTHASPILLKNTDATDYNYNREMKEQVDWFSEGFEKYYRINSRTLIIENQQPDGFCLNTAPWEFTQAATCMQAPIERFENNDDDGKDS